MNTNWNEYLVLGMEEVLGPVELSKLQKTCAGSIDPVLSMRVKMNEFYGDSSARGLAICTGRAAFKHLVAEKGSEIGFEGIDYRFLPIRSRILRGLELLSRWLGTTYGLNTVLRSEAREFRLEVKDSPNAGGSVIPCDFIAGLVQEFLAWTSGGKFYAVHEIECRGAGAEQCTYVVGKFPLE